MSEPLTQAKQTPAPARPFPWFCPKCRRKEVQRTVISYQCQRSYAGQAILVVMSDLAVPKCGHCGELVFDYEAEQQIERAFQAQINASNGTDRTAK